MQEQKKNNHQDDFDDTLGQILAPGPDIHQNKRLPVVENPNRSSTIAQAPKNEKRFEIIIRIAAAIGVLILLALFAVNIASR